MPPLKSSHPVPARNPPTTGYGMNRTRLPSRKVPSTRKMTPHDNVTTSVAATTVRKTSGVSHLPTDAVWQILMMLMALVAVLSARIESTAVAASCTLPTTPRSPARHARNPSVSAAAPRHRRMPPPRRGGGGAGRDHEGSERDREDHFAAADDQPRGELRQPALGPSLLGHRPSHLVEQCVELAQRVAQPFRQHARQPPVHR